MEQEITFGVWLRKRRKALGLTREELARMVCYSVSGLRKVEIGERRPSKQLAGLLAEALEIPAAERDTFMRAARAEKPTPNPPQNATLPGLSGAPASTPAPGLIQLPGSLTPLVGRETELAALSQMLCDPSRRLVTLLGPGGIGKTRLALETAHQIQGSFAGGAVFVSLASVNSTEHILPAISAALGITLQASDDPKARLLESLRDLQMLLVLDNFEHLCEGAALLVELLHKAPQVKLLCTSRERLGLQGEWLFELQGLPVPQGEPAQGFENYSAISLFLQCARRLSGLQPMQTEALHLQDEDYRSIARICQLVDGNPLAIELAASWMRVLTCQEIAQEIERSLDFLAVSMRDLPERHRSMRAVFDQSWRLLADEETQALRRLSVFRGGFTRKGAEQVAGTSLMHLSALVAKSLVRPIEDGRYDLHEVVRQYALEQLHACGETTHTCRKHLEYFLNFAVEAGEGLRGPQQADWFKRLGQDHDNIRAALEWAFTPGPAAQAADGLRLVTSIYRFWPGRGHVREGIEWLERGLAAGDSLPLAVRARALNILGWLVNHGEDTRRAESMLRECVAIYRQLADAEGLANALDTLGDLAWRTGDFENARDAYAESVSLYRKGGDPRNIGLSLACAGRLHVDYGHTAEAETLLAEGLQLLESLQDLRGQAYCLNALGRLALFTGDLNGSASRFRQALHLNRSLGYLVDLSENLQELAVVKAGLGEQLSASRLWAAAAGLQKRMGVSYPANDPLYRLPAARCLIESVQDSLAGEAVQLDEAIAEALEDELETR